MAPAGMAAHAVSLRHRMVRDLAWTILSPSLLAPGSMAYAGAGDVWCRRNFLEYRGKLIALDNDPAELIDAVGDPASMALGVYFEKLVAFWLAGSGRYRVILRNQQVMGEGRTLGEFDFILYDQRERSYCHWETAVKFYLGDGDTESFGAWHGPRRIDRLDKKFDRMTRRQIMLGDTPEGARLLASHGVMLSERRIVLKGRLFYPVASHTVPHRAPVGANHGHLSGWWMERDEFMRRFGTATMRWARLPKHLWLSPIEAGDARSVTSAEILRELDADGADLPVCVAGIAGGGERERGFIVPAGWGRS